jgi:hypothetical protein
VNDFETACYAKAKKIAGDDAFDTTGIYTEEGGCDLTRAAIVKINKKCKNSKDEKCFKADDQGYYDETEAANGNKYGEEERQIVMEETVTVMCEDGMQLDDVTGQCVPDEQVDELKAFRATHAMSAASITGVTVDDEYVMMGFTFAPPSIRWGLFYTEEVCFWFFGCFTLFEAKIGYDFGLGVGFRLPMKATVSDLPEGPIVAEDLMELSTNIESENFSAQQYRDFCDHYDMGDTAFCDRFAFPDALDPDDGDELAIRLKAFAGLKLVIVEIPLINWGVDVDMDIPEMCSLYLALNSIDDVTAEMIENPDLNFGEVVNALGLNCGTYTTPFGNDDEGNPLQFPFIANAPFVNQMVRADCAEAFVRGETIKLPTGEVYPICTGLILGVHGASLGLGLGVDLEMNSNLIEATASVSGDAVFSDKDPNAEQKVDLKYHAADFGGSDPVGIDKIKVDNHDDNDDYARLNLNDFTYCLNNFSIRLKGQAMFGGILTIFPDFPDFTIYRFTVPLINETCFIPIGQHAGTGKGYEVPVFVKNYGLDIDVRPTTPTTTEEDTLEIKPGELGQFTVEVTNKGNVTGSFDNFIYQLSDEAPNGDHWTTDPSPDNLKNMEIATVTRDDKGSLTLSIKPFRDPWTSPGKYPFTILADSKEAKEHALSTSDPSGNSRTGASDIAYVRVIAFYDVQVEVDPGGAELKPGIEQNYSVTGTNMGNVEDSMSVAVEFKDFNQSGCTLTTLGEDDVGCPFRALSTVIQRDNWTTVNQLPTSFGPLAVTANQNDGFTITVPRDWAAMEDTTYKFVITVVSSGDNEDPRASGTSTVEHKAVATKESMTRYTSLEIDELIGEIEKANAQGFKTGGLLPIAMYPGKKKINQALELILDGQPARASNALSSNVHIMEAFIHALDGFSKKLPVSLVDDWRARALAIIEDLQTAAASGVTSAL